MTKYIRHTNVRIIILCHKYRVINMKAISYYGKNAYIMTVEDTLNQRYKITGFYSQ